MYRMIPAALCAALLLLTAPAYAETIFVSNEKDNTITVVDGKTLQVIKTIKVSRRPRGVVLSHANVVDTVAFMAEAAQLTSSAIPTATKPLSDHVQA